MAPPRVPPLDCEPDRIWSRTDPAGVPPGHSNQIVSLISDNSEENSYAWPLYVSLNASEHPNANQNSSQSTGAYVRLFNSSTGSPWAAAYHTDVTHGVSYDGATTQAGGVTIGANIEFQRKSAKGLVIGLELNAAGSELPPDTAVDLQGKFKTGLQMRANDIRMDAGARVFLAPSTWLTYNTAADRIELWRKGRKVSSF